MSLPVTLNAASPTATDVPLPGQISGITAALEDLFGVPDLTPISAAISEVTSAGLKSLILQDAAADPSSAGSLRRNGTTLVFHDGNGARGLPVLLDRDVSLQTVANTTGEVAVYTYSVPAGTLRATRKLRTTLLGDKLDTLGSVTTTIKAYLQSTLIGSQAMTVTPHASRDLVKFSVEVSATGTTSAQIGLMELVLGAQGSAGTPGTSGAAQGMTQAMHNAMAVDTTSAAILTITVTHSTSSASLDFRAHTIQTELL